MQTSGEGLEAGAIFAAGCRLGAAPPAGGPDVGLSLVDFSVELAKAARIFTLLQVAKHPEIAWRSQPVKRASAYLSDHKDIFEACPAVFGQPWRFRLTRDAKRERHLSYKNVDGHSQRSDHWLAIGDLWVGMVVNGGKPLLWYAEPAGCDDFDVLAVEPWNKRAWLVEVQRSPMTRDRWLRRWSRHTYWMERERWRHSDLLKSPSGKPIKPKMMLVNLTRQQSNTISCPLGVYLVDNVAQAIQVMQGTR